MKGFLEYNFFKSFDWLVNGLAIDFMPTFSWQWYKFHCACSFGFSFHTSKLDWDLPFIILLTVIMIIGYFYIQCKKVVWYFLRGINILCPSEWEDAWSMFQWITSLVYWGKRFLTLTNLNNRNKDQKPKRENTTKPSSRGNKTETKKVKGWRDYGKSFGKTQAAWKWYDCWVIIWNNMFSISQSLYDSN